MNEEMDFTPNDDKSLGIKEMSSKRQNGGMPEGLPIALQPEGMMFQGNQMGPIVNVNAQEAIAPLPPVPIPQPSTFRGLQEKMANQRIRDVEPIVIGKY